VCGLSRRGFLCGSTASLPHYCFDPRGGQRRSVLAQLGGNAAKRPVAIPALRSNAFIAVTMSCDASTTPRDGTARTAAVGGRGPSGIGKTELLSRFVARLDASPTVTLRARCHPKRPCRSRPRRRHRRAEPASASRLG